MLLSDQSFAVYRKEFHFSVYCNAQKAIMEKKALVPGISFNRGLKIVKVYLHLPAVVYILLETKAGLIVLLWFWLKPNPS